MQERMLVGLIGANIQKSLSPALFEDACAAKGIRGHYHLMDMDQLPGRNLADLLLAARTAGFKGVNITYPCKETVIPLLDGLSPEALQIGAVNTVAIGADGRTTGYNTDRIGFRRAFEQQLGAELVAGKAAMLVGAGGAGRAAAFALFDLGLRTLRVNDKDAEQARALVQTLAGIFGVERAQLEMDPSGALSAVGGVVNATPVGMLGIPGNPIPLDAIAATHWVADVIYTPLETRLIKTARSRGARVMGGAGMCVHQAAETFKLFTGSTADVGRMQRVFAEAAAVREKTLETAG
jgi:shikimate dehydrogenase